MVLVPCQLGPLARNLNVDFRNKLVDSLQLEVLLLVGSRSLATDYRVMHKITQDFIICFYRLGSEFVDLLL